LTLFSINDTVTFHFLKDAPYSVKFIDLQLKLETSKSQGLAKIFNLSLPPFSISCILMKRSAVLITAKKTSNRAHHAVNTFDVIVSVHVSVIFNIKKTNVDFIKELAMCHYVTISALACGRVSTGGDVDQTTR